MLRRKEIELLKKIIKSKDENLKDELIQALCKTHITLEEMDRIDDILRFY